MQPTPQQIDEQVELERDAIRQGLKRLQDQTLKLENQNYASASIYGISSIDSLLPDVAEEIDNTVSRIHERKNGHFFKGIHQYLADIDSQSKSAKKYLDKQVKLGSKATYTICDDNSVQMLRPDKPKLFKDENDSYVIFDFEFDSFDDEYRPDDNYNPYADED